LGFVLLGDALSDAGDTDDAAGIAALGSGRAVAED
jgi:hypothetical protein